MAVLIGVLTSYAFTANIFAARMITLPCENFLFLMISASTAGNFYLTTYSGHCAATKTKKEAWIS